MDVTVWSIEVGGRYAQKKIEHVQSFEIDRPTPQRLSCWNDWTHYI